PTRSTFLPYTTLFRSNVWVLSKRKINLQIEMKMKNYIFILLVAILGISACKKEEYIDYQAIALEQYGKDTVIINEFIADNNIPRSEEHTSELQSRENL